MLNIPESFVRRGPQVPTEGHSLASLLQYSCYRHAHRIAIDEPTRQLSYTQLRAMSHQIAAGILERLPAPGNRIACAVARSAEQIAALIAIISTGNVAVPIDPMDPPEKTDHVYTTAGCQLAIVANTAEIPDSLQRFPALVVQEQRASTSSFPTDLPINSASSDVAFIFFTSGSSGRPKGVEVCNAATLNALMWRNRLHGIDSSDRVFYKSAVTFDISLWEIFLPLLHGASLTVARPLGNADPQYIAQTIVERGVTISQFTGSMLRSSLPELASRSPETLRVICCGGESWTAELAAECTRTIPARLFNIYGQTETSLGVLAREVGRDARTSISLQDVCMNTSVSLIDDSGAPVRHPGQSGELVVMGTGLSPGYTRDEYSTLRAFETVMVAGKTDRAYRTGDIFSIEDDGLSFKGRNDNQVKVHGIRIELELVENLMLGVRGIASALCAQDRSSGTLCAFVVTDRPVDDDTIRLQLLRHLPAAVLPNAIVRVDTIPVSSNGKVDRRGFLQLHEHLLRTATV